MDRWNSNSGKITHSKTSSPSYVNFCVPNLRNPWFRKGSVVSEHTLGKSQLSFCPSGHSLFSAANVRRSKWITAVIHIKPMIATRSLASRQGPWINDKPTSIQWISKWLAPNHPKKTSKISHSQSSQHLKTTTQNYVSLIFCYQYDNYIDLYYYKNFHDMIRCMWCCIDVVHWEHIKSRDQKFVSVHWARDVKKHSLRETSIHRITSWKFL